MAVLSGGHRHPLPHRHQQPQGEGEAGAHRLPRPFPRAPPASAPPLPASSLLAAAKGSSGVCLRSSLGPGASRRGVCGRETGPLCPHNPGSLSPRGGSPLPTAQLEPADGPQCRAWWPPSWAGRGGPSPLCPLPAFVPPSPTRSSGPSSAKSSSHLDLVSQEALPRPLRLPQPPSPPRLEVELPHLQEPEPGPTALQSGL